MFLMRNHEGGRRREGGGRTEEGVMRGRRRE